MEKPEEIGGRGPLGEAYLAGELRQRPLAGEFRPSRREDVTELDRLDPKRRADLVRRALVALRAGDIAYGLLAAGASSRMNPATMPESARRLAADSAIAEPKSKALVPVTRVGDRVLTFLDVFFENVARLSRESATNNPALLLVSGANSEEILGYLESKQRFGLPAKAVLHFEQSLDTQIVATVEDVEKARKNFQSDEDVASALALSADYAGCELSVAKPAGHGEFLHQLVSSGTAGRLLERGIRFISIRNIDNTGAALDESWLAAFGLMLEEGRDFAVEVSRRPDGPAGKGGALILRPGSSFQLAEDPSFEGTGVNARDSFYINDAVAVLKMDYVYRIYDTSEAELRAASPEQLLEIADRGRRKFPPLIDVKPVRLPSGSVVGAFVRETNVWESTGVESGLRVGAVGVLSVKDVEDGFDDLSAEEQRAKALSVRFAATKKWEDYDGINAKLVPHVARRILDGPLIDPKLL